MVHETPAGSQGPWYDAYFYSGGSGNAYTTADVGLDFYSGGVISAELNGADPSCGAASGAGATGDKATFQACVVGPSNESSACKGGSPQECYGIKHAGTRENKQGYFRYLLGANSYNTIPATGVPGSGSLPGQLCVDTGVKPPPNARISMVNPQPAGGEAKEFDGWVAAIEHGGLGAVPGRDVTCTTKKWDSTMVPADDKSLCKLNDTECPTYAALARKLWGIARNCGNPKAPSTFVHENTNGTFSCLIKKSVIETYFPGTTANPYFETGISTTGGAPEKGSIPETEGVAIGWGHGVFDSGCGAVTFMQQGPVTGSVPHNNPGHTTISMQSGTRAWSGEWSDAVAPKETGVQPVAIPADTGGYLRDGSNTATAESGSQSCLQPRIRKVDYEVFSNILDNLCAELPSAECEAPLGHRRVRICKYAEGS